MSQFILLGLFSWIAIGVLTGLAAPAVLARPGHRGRAVVVAVLGAVVGGLVATVGGFGGLAGFDVRSLVTATLAAMLFSMLSRLKAIRTR